MRQITNFCGKIIKNETKKPIFLINKVGYSSINKGFSIKNFDKQNQKKIALKEYDNIINISCDKYEMAYRCDEIIKKCLEYEDNFILKYICKKIGQNITIKGFREMNMKIPLLCKEVIRQDPMKLSVIPNNIKTEYLCNIANEMSKGKAFMFVNLELQTYNMALKAVKHNGSNLKYVREDLINEEIITSAIKSDGKAIKYVKNPTRENYIDAINADPYCISYIKEMDNELYMLAIKKNPMVLQFIGEKEQTKEMCKYAVSNSDNSFILGYVKKQTLEICEIAIKKNPKSMCFVKINTEQLL